MITLESIFFWLSCFPLVPYLIHLTSLFLFVPCLLFFRSDSEIRNFLIRVGNLRWRISQSWDIYYNNTTRNNVDIYQCLYRDTQRRKDHPVSDICMEQVKWIGTDRIRPSVWVARDKCRAVGQDIGGERLSCHFELREGGWRFVGKAAD
jgi:hypothetical protein